MFSSIWLSHRYDISLEGRSLSIIEGGYRVGQIACKETKASRGQCPKRLELCTQYGTNIIVIYLRSIICEYRILLGRNEILTYNLCKVPTCASPLGCLVPV